MWASPPCFHESNETVTLHLLKDLWLFILIPHVAWIILQALQKGTSSLWWFPRRGMRTVLCCPLGASIFIQLEISNFKVSVVCIILMTLILISLPCHSSVEFSFTRMTALLAKMLFALLGQNLSLSNSPSSSKRGFYTPESQINPCCQLQLHNQLPG